MRLPNISMSFVWIVLCCGVASLLAIIGNFSVLGLHRHPTDAFKFIPDVSLELGRKKLVQYGCGSCHVIPGIPGARGRVGPSLADISEQMFIAGKLKNSNEEMIFWIRHPQKVSPGSGMPDLNVTLQDAELMATYLYHKKTKGFFYKLRTMR